MSGFSLRVLSPACVLLMMISGCSREPEPGVEQKPVPSPAQLQADGKTWTRKGDLTAENEKLLAGWFKKNPSIADNPAVNGKPTVYTQGNLHRFYWLSPLGEQVSWFFVEFAGSRFVTSGEGQGEPFATLQ